MRDQKLGESLFPDEEIAGTEGQRCVKTWLYQDPGNMAK